MVDLPANFEVKEALGNGDCFFDSVAQGLKQVNPKFSFTAKSLREVCKRFAQSQLQCDKSWLKEALKTEELIDEYVTRIEYNTNDIQQEFGAVNLLGLTQPIWGRSEIEGRIICNEYEVKLHVLQKDFAQEKEIWMHKIVDSKGSRSVDAVNYNKEENMVHVMNTGFLHFQPILKNKVQHNDHSHHKDKIETKKVSSEVIKNLTQQNADVKKDNGTVITELADEVGKDKQEPKDEDWYVKNPHAAQTEGYSYEIQLAMWFLLVGKEKVEKKEIKSFYLASDIKEAPRFGHIVFKYQKEGCGSKVIFLQAKHKKNETCDNEHKEEAGLGKVFDLPNAWKAYAKIKGCYSCKKTNNRIFGEEFSDVECSFIFFTNALPNIPCINIHKKAVDPEDILYFGKTHNYYYYSLTPCEATDKIILNCDSSSKKEELNEFLGQLKLFFAQPNEKQLGEFIKQRIKSQYSATGYDVDVVFASVKNKIQEWHGRKRNSEFITIHNRYFEDAARVSFKFDVKEPVALFTGRSEELENLHKVLQGTSEAVISQTTSITGLGGVGKTELARKYISQYSKEYDENVIWINAENYLTIADSFGRVAEDKLGINVLDEKGNRKKTEIIAEEVYEFFARMHRKSLFIFDNSVKYRGYEEKDEGIDKFLPSGPDKPHILITSRDQEWGKIKTLTLNVFSEAEATEFINKTLKDTVFIEKNEIKKLAAELQYLPLALTQATAYIKMENSELRRSDKKRFTISSYLELFKANTRDLLCSRQSNEILDHYSGTVMTTWQITITKIKQTKIRGEVAIKILNIMSYLASDKIPVDDIFSTLINDEKLRHSAVELLDKYCMVILRGGKVNVHRLVQQVSRIELEEQGKNNEIIQETFRMLKQSFPYNSHKLNDISRKKLLLPHSEVFLSHIYRLITGKPRGAPKEVAKIYLDLVTLMVDGYYDLSNPQRKKELLEVALPNFEYHYGPNHFKVALTLRTLGNAYGALGDPYKQKELMERALHIQKDHYESNNFQVAITLRSLGNAHGDLGDSYKEKKLLERALKIQEHHYEPNHFEVALTLVSLGNAHGDLGDHYKQKELLQRALQIFEDHYGSNHFEVAATLVNLSNAYGDLGDPYKEKELLERALKIFKDHYGPNHFQVALTLVNLGNAHGALGDPYKQKELLERALKIFEDHYGPNHFQVAVVLVNLGNAHGALGDHHKKKQLLKRALKIQIDHYGPNHVQVAIALVSLSNAHGALGDPYKQKELLEQALKLFEDHYGPNHFQVAAALRSLGNAHGALGVPYKQKELLERALKIFKDYYGPNHFEVAASLVNLGNAHGDLGDPYKQKELLERALKILEDHYGPNNFEVAASLVNLGKAHGDLGDPYKQKELLERALKILEDHYGPNHFQVAIALGNLGNVYGDLGDHYKQKELLERALKIQENQYGPNHFEVAASLVNLGNAHGAVGNPYKQKELLERALKIFEDHYGPNHFHVAVVLVNLGNAHGALDDHHKKKELLERAVKIREDHYGPNHVQVAIALRSLSNAHGALGDPYKQKELLMRALQIQEDNYGPNHSEFAETSDFVIANESLGDLLK